MHIPFDSWEVLHALVHLLCQLRSMEATIQESEFFFDLYFACLIAQIPSIRFNVAYYW